MRRHLALIALGVLTIALAGPAVADDARYGFGGDTYIAGHDSTLSEPVVQDAFLAGYTVLLSAPVGGNAHIAGYSVTADAAVTGNLYAAGNSVTATAPVGGDVTAIGNTVNLSSASSVAGNSRVAGATVTLAAPMAGSVLVTAQSLTLGSVIAGDLSFFGEAIAFAPGARVDGTVTIHAPTPIAVPVSVASADRVTFELANAPNYVTEAGKTANGALSSIWPAFGAMALWLVLLLAAGVAAITLSPVAVATAQTHSAERPLRLFGRGILVFSATVGLAVVAGLTVIGLLALPAILVAIVLTCSFAYVAGCYLVAIRVFAPFLAIDSRLKRIGVLVFALVLATLIGLIPFLGWLITLTLICFGFGGMAASRSPRRTEEPASKPAAGEPALPVIL